MAHPHCTHVYVKDAMKYVYTILSGGWGAERGEGRGGEGGHLFLLQKQTSS